MYLHKHTHSYRYLSIKINLQMMKSVKDLRGKSQTKEDTLYTLYINILKL